MRDKRGDGDDEPQDQSRRALLIKIAWATPVVASLQLSPSQLAQAASPPGTTENNTTNGATTNTTPI